jgi:hypothetical protein
MLSTLSANGTPGSYIQFWNDKGDLAHQYACEWGKTGKPVSMIPRAFR